MRYFKPEHGTQELLNTIKPSLSYLPGKDLVVWKNQVRERLRNLLGEEPERIDVNVEVEYTESNRLFTEKRFVFTSEKYVDIPAHLLIPYEGEKPFPVVICLQGHTTGMHISLGRTKYEKDEDLIAGGRDFAIQAVRNGYAALVIEQRHFGERKDREEFISRRFNYCHHSTMVSLLYGRTMIGQRVWDISRAIDALQYFPEIDIEKIACMGNSGGGTAAYYAACMDERIKVAMPSCAVCSYKESIGKIYHCECNYIPNVLRYFDMGDLACLIAPRPLILVAGKKDMIFPFEAVEKTYHIVNEIYSAFNAGEQCTFVVGQEGHQFYPKEAWPVFNEASGFKKQ